MKHYVILFSILGGISLVSCGNQLQDANEKIDSLETAIKHKDSLLVALSEEVKGYRYSPDKVIAEMRSNIKEGKYQDIRALYITLKQYHPEAPEIKTAEALVAQAEKMEEQARAKAAEARKQAKRSLVGRFYCGRSGDTYEFKSDHTGIFFAGGSTSSRFTWSKSGSNVVVNHQTFGKTRLTHNEDEGTLIELSESMGPLVFEKE